MSMPADDRGVVVTCASCGQKNRMLFERIQGPAKCGKCGRALAAPDAPVEIRSETSFRHLIGSSPLPVVVDYWAPWCGPCRMVAPELEKVASSHHGRWVIAKVNTEELPELGERFGIRSIPTMAVFTGGREIARTAGARPAAQIEQFIESALRAA